MKKILLLSIFLILVAIFIVFYIVKSDKIITEEPFKPTDTYLKNNGCNYDMSNNEYTNCAQKALETIKIEKRTLFESFLKLIQSKPDITLLSDKDLYDKFINWYKNSEINNHERCLADVYWTVAGSAYAQNMAICEIFETQRDIDILNENYKGFKDWIDKM